MDILVVAHLLNGLLMVAMPVALAIYLANHWKMSSRIWWIGAATLGGQEYYSNNITANFVPKQSLVKVILPVLGIIGAAVLLSALLPFLSRRGKGNILPLGAERKYGAGGGGICPNCHRPFALPLFSVRLGLSKLASCPFCGKWSLVRVESINELRGAQKTELDWGKSGKQSETPEKEKLLEKIKDSKYLDLKE